MSYGARGQRSLQPNYGRFSHEGDQRTRLLPNFDLRHSYERFRGQRSRLILYGSLIVLGLASWFWAGQRVLAIEAASAAEQRSLAEEFRLTRASAIHGWSASADELMRRGAALLDGPKRSLGIEILEDATARDGTIRDAFIQLGYGYLKNGRWERAKQALEQARSLDPIYPDTHRLLAEAYHALGDIAAEQLARDRASLFKLVPSLPELTAP